MHRSRPAPGEEEREQDPGGQEQDGELGHACDARDEARHHPEPGVSGPQEPGQQVREPRQRELVDAVVAEEGIQDEPHRRDQERQPGQAGRERLAPELARDEADQHQRAGAGQGRRDVVGEEGLAEERPVERHQGRNERREVHVSPREVLAQGDLVQLVAEEAVVRGGGEVDRELGGGADGDDPAEGGHSE